MDSQRYLQIRNKVADRTKYDLCPITGQSRGAKQALFYLYDTNQITGNELDIMIDKMNLTNIF
jgi:hypothetical protein